VVYQASVVSVMIASPGDVSKERELVRSIIHDTNDIFASSSKTVLLPVGWESHSAPELGGRPQAIINKRVLKDCDLLVGIFWTRLGTPTGTSESGTVEEIKEHVKSGKPAMIYFSRSPVAPETLDPEQFAALKTFERWCKEQGLVESYDDTSEFVEKFRRQLHFVLRDNNYIGMEVAKIAEVNEGAIKSELNVSLTEEAANLLIEAAKGNGEILQLDTLGGRTVQANGKEFCGTWDRRELAKYDAALAQLIELGLIAEQGSRGQIFALTAKGFSVADAQISETD